ncbi:putative bifunctional diguanylate cyclase/phosphodiesterase [Massilia sp. PAMC28688]|uniref:putative bifunctional diguanylate cyclase/phosphodiesterase n=1 Tax=Massilia sp. PAMC28688 TaxID=2861283 RepID=UPI0035A67BAA
MKARVSHSDMVIVVFFLALIIVLQILGLLVIHQRNEADDGHAASLLIGLAIATMVTGAAGVVSVIQMARRRRYPASTGRRAGNSQIEFIHEHEISELADAFSNIRDKVAAREQEIHRLAYWDRLTELPNRAQFVLQLDASIADAEKRGHSVFVLMMDLDRFKYVNDVMGHSYGDSLLRVVAQRLQLALADGTHAPATLARLGGDEFAVLLPGTGIEQAQRMASRILASLETPLSLEDQTVDIGASLGIAGYPEHAAGSHTLLSVAEVAMYAAKQRKDGAVVYDARIDGSSEINLSLLSEMRAAMERDEFRLRVQPKISLNTGQVVGFESLVRWEHPERGFLFPDEFIAFAEQTGFIRILTRWVLEQSATLCQQLAAVGIDLKVSVNLSPRDLLDQDLPLKFGEILARHQLAPSSFCLEITESAIMDDPVRAQQTLERLHAMGFSLSIDDFGTGYSSLAYLKRLPVDELKIDKSFVLNMEHDIDDTKIVRSTIDLGHNLGLRVVAEGIESAAVWHLLAALGCDQGQGHFMGRPIPGNQLIDWIAAWRAPTGGSPDKRSKALDGYDGSEERG